MKCGTSPRPVLPPLAQVQQTENFLILQTVSRPYFVQWIFSSERINRLVKYSLCVQKLNILKVDDKSTRGHLFLLYLVDFFVMRQIGS